MASTYISTLLEEIDKTIDSCKNFKLVMDGFLQDYPFVEGVNQELSPSEIQEVIKKNENIEALLIELKKHIVAEEEKDGRNN